MEQEQSFIHLQLQKIKDDDCKMRAVVQARDDQILILYSPRERYHIYARIIYPSGVATKRERNDPVIFLDKKPGSRTLVLSYIRILQDKINCGYGSILMSYVLRHLVPELDVDTIQGIMQETVNREHDARLRHFYTKFGFHIDEDRRIIWRRS